MKLFTQSVLFNVISSLGYLTGVDHGLCSVPTHNLQQKLWLWFTIRWTSYVHYATEIMVTLIPAELYAKPAKSMKFFTQSVLFNVIYYLGYLWLMIAELT